MSRLAEKKPAAGLFRPPSFQVMNQDQGTFWLMSSLGSGMGPFPTLPYGKIT